MRRLLIGLGVIIIIFIGVIIPFFGLMAFMSLKTSETYIQNVNRQKRSVDFKINEEDFINTMFLRSSFFENGSDTNYFVNPILKTSKLLTYNENGYLDFLKDSYATGIVFDKPSDKFLDLYKNGDNYVKHYSLGRFYNVDKKFFLKDLTNFMYTYFKKYDVTGKAENMRQSIKDLEQIKFNEDNGKLINNPEIENLNNNKTYIGIAKCKDNTFYLVDGKKFNGKYYKYKSVYRGDGNSQPKDFKINNNTGEIIDGKVGSEGGGFYNLIDVVVEENIRVQQGGSANYEKLDVDGTQRIIFDFEIIDEVDKYKIKKVVYRMILTINREQIIRSGSISLIHYINNEYDENKLNFSFDFFQSVLDDENLNPLGEFKIQNYIYQNQNKFIYNQLEGLIYINDFLKQFFSNILMPVFTNRGAFMEASYLDFLTYDTVVVNFLGLQPDNFLAVVKLYNVINNKFEQTEKDEIYFKLQGKNILNSSFKIMNNFYKNYLRAMFDLQNETYIQGYNKKFGLLVSNGFKIYPKYFYFSDKYKNLDVKIYSSHANKFYQTKYGRVFNFDYSVGKHFIVDTTYDYLLEDIYNYQLRFKNLSIQKVGYGVFELQAQKENEFYHYYDFNFGIYNGKDLTSLVDKPTGQGGGEQIENCKGYDMVCHLKNGAIWIVNNIPGIKQANELASGVGKLFQTTYNFFSQIFEIGKFDLDFYIVITNTFLLIIFMKFIRMF